MIVIAHEQKYVYFDTKDKKISEAIEEGKKSFKNIEGRDSDKEEASLDAHKKIKY